MLNKGLELEHAARVQYLSHAEMVKGPDAEKIVERLKEIAGDEKKHEDMFRNLVGNYLGGVPSMAMDVTKPARERKEIFDTNMSSEKHAIDFYKQIYQKATDNKKDLPYVYETIEHEIRHIIIDEQEHVSELALLMGI